MKKYLNIAVDIETLSKRPTAAIISIAAKTFALHGQKVEMCMEFRKSIDATSCALYGFDFDQGTVDWWSKQPDAVKDQLQFNSQIKWALNEFARFIEDSVKFNSADGVRIWCQGTDFDISILRNAFVVVNKDSEEKTIPWKYYDVRDARTFVHEGVRLLAPEVEDLVTFIPECEGYVKHDAMSDVNKLIHDVRWVDEQLCLIIKPVENV